jgi:hypothetical protein
MKRLSLLATVFLIVSSLTALGQNQAKIVFEKLEHNFGTFKESSGIQTVIFKFTNTGKIPLILNSVSASCGCTTPKWTNQPVPPGGKGEVQVSYDPTGRPYPFSKTVSVNSNAENSTVILTISGTVQEKEKTLAELYPEKIGDLRVKTSNIYLQRVFIDEIKKETFELINDSDKPVKVSILNAPPTLKIAIVPATIPARGKAVVTAIFDARQNAKYGFVTQRAYLSLNGSTDYNYSFGIIATVEEDFSKLTPDQLNNAPVASYSEKSHDFGDIKQDNSYEHTFNLVNNGKSELIIRDVTSSCGCTAAAPSKKVIAPGETAPIKVSFNSHGKRGRQSNSITVITNDPKNPTTSLIISSNVITPQ